MRRLLSLMMMTGLLAVGCTEESIDDEGDEEEAVGEVESAFGCIPSEVNSCGIQPEAKQETANGVQSKHAK